MMEITTGVVFLMSSLYGGGHAHNEAVIAQANTGVDSVQATTTETRAFTTPKEIEAYIRAQYPNDPILVDIARCESTFRQYDKDGMVVRGRVNRDDVGVMQINEKYHSERAAKLGYDIYSVEGNVAFGKYLYDQYGAQPWSSSSPCWAGTHDLARK